jgi:1-acyl-sn-glycerol-3-phosphate acyltransferase
VEILRHPLPWQRHSPLNRLIARAVVLAFHRKVLAIHGLHRIAVENDPFLLVLNHNQWQEAVILPTLLIFQRGGKLIHFVSDWNFQLIPLAALILRRSQVITIVAKPARPAILNVFRPLF